MSDRVLVTGGRDYSDRSFLNRMLDLFHRNRGISLVIHGDATGADRLASEWADARQVPQDRKPALWGKVDGVAGKFLRRNRAGNLYNTQAGFDRNREMLDSAPTHVFAFPGGNGTDHMCSMVQRAIADGRDIAFIDLRYVA